VYTVLDPSLWISGMWNNVFVFIWLSWPNTISFYTVMQNTFVRQWTAK